MRIIVLIAAMLFYSGVFCQKQGNGRKDTDGDGIVDVQDMDDDNDGILDVDENKRETSKLRQWVNRINVNTSSNNVLFQKGVAGWSNGAASSKFSEFGFDRDYDVSFRARDAQMAVVGFSTVDNSTDIIDIEYGLYFENSKFRIVNSGEFQNNPKPYKDVDNFKISYRGDEILYYHEDELIFSQEVLNDLDFQLDISFYGNPEGYGHGDLKDFTLAFSFSDMDLDNDGIINSLDLDSDGDGCFDVFEAGLQDPDEDGILGEGTPVVDADGKIISEAAGYGCSEGEECQEVSFNFLNANFNACEINNYGVVLDTRRMPLSQFNAIYRDETFNNQNAGTEESVLKIETAEAEVNEIFVKVLKSDQSRELSLKIVQAEDNTLQLLVDVNGEWKTFSSDFYLLENNTIIFRQGPSPDVISPFKLNLQNGVYYDRSGPLELIVENAIDLTNSSMVINGPNGTSYTVLPNGDIFSWDGIAAPSGNYHFQLIIQQKTFVGQFIISGQ